MTEWVFSVRYPWWYSSFTQPKLLTGKIMTPRGGLSEATCVTVPHKNLICGKKRKAHKPEITLIQCYYQTHSRWGGTQMPNKGLQAEARQLLLSDWLKSSAAISPVIHSPVHGKHPEWDLWGEGAHLVSSINNHLFNKGILQKDKNK